MFDGLVLGNWCDAGKTGEGPVSTAELLAKTGVIEESAIWNPPFPSLDQLSEACDSVAQARDVTKGAKMDSWRRRTHCVLSLIRLLNL